MSIKNQPAFPPGTPTSTLGSRGLTKLEYFAGLAMQGLLATSDHQISQATGDEIAGMSVHTAKALIAELEKSQ